ncbi:MAG: hypothetical protein P8Y67_03650 [Alphaproteobacteria bacterium]
MSLAVQRFLKVCVVYACIAALLNTSLLIFPSGAAPTHGASALREPASSQTPATEKRISSPTITMEECRNLNDPQVRQRIRNLTQRALVGELKRIDFKKLLDKQWLATHMDERLDIEIDDAVRVLRADTNILERAYSNISQETAQKMAVAVAERTFASESFKIGLTDIAVGVGKEFGMRIENAAGRVAEPLIACVRSALQTRYGSAVAEVFTKETEDDTKVSSQAGSTKISTTDLAIHGSGAITGIVLIVSRRVIARMAMNLGRRVAGAVATRLAATLVGLLGLALLINDLMEASEGVFPIIADRMKSDDAKNLIKEEIAKSIEADLRKQTGQIAAETADRIYSFWLDFKQKYDALLSLAEKNPTFAAFLKERRIGQLGRLGRLVSLLRKQEGEENVVRRVKNGSLAEALFNLNDTGVSLAVHLKSLDQALAWNKLAGPKLAEAVKYGLPQHVKPDELTKSQLSGLLSFNNRKKALQVAQLNTSARKAILSLPPDDLKNLTHRLTADELGALGIYLSRLEHALAGKVLRIVNRNPDVMQSLSPKAVQNAIFSSRDQSSAVSMLLRDNSVLNFGHISGDFTSIRKGQVHYRIFLERYWVGLLVVLFLLMLVLLWLRRTFSSRKRTVIIRTTEKRC